MVPTAWIYSIQFGFWLPRLHQHLHPHSARHLGSRTPNLRWHQYLHLNNLWGCTDYRIRAGSANKWLHHYVHATLYTSTFLVYPLLTTNTLYWITTNTSATYTTQLSCSLLHWLLTFSAYHNLGFIHINCHECRIYARYETTLLLLLLLPLLLLVFKAIYLFQSFSRLSWNTPPPRKKELLLKFGPGLYRPSCHPTKCWSIELQK